MVANRVRNKQCDGRALSHFWVSPSKRTLVRMLKIVVSPHTDGHTATKSDPYGGQERTLMADAPFV